MASTIGTASISQQLRLKNESLDGLNRQKACTACSKNKSVVIRAVKAPTQLQQRSPASTGTVKQAMTMTEKILARAAEKATVSPGENLWVNVDTLMTHDVSGPGTIGIFKREFGPQAKVWDHEKIVIIPDHYIFTNDERANRNVDIIRDFAQEQNIKYFYDIKDRSNFKANPDYKGVCHIALAQEGHCKPGEVLFGTDSHTCNAGAFGQFATGIGNTDAGFIMGTGKLLIKVPPTLRFILDGDIPHYVLAKDLILQIIGEITISGGTYRAMEFTGSAVEKLTMEDRMTLCNMVIEAGGKNGVIAADQITFDYLEGQKVKVPTFLVPATQKVWMDLYTIPVPGANGKTCAQIFEDAGCDTPASPNCGACMGGPRDTYARVNEPQVCVSTTNRNFPGRMGHKEGQIYLASPYTAAASALTGFVTDPRDFL
ncbi:3-isopropylmalate dehydratase large subunit, chloroplastic isoform X3 [Cryptomeria japonica]|uniref:3-isopropylmalate dehydratase large subunit, chloroplastic isoform X3 n=1 Tax=Cryptomeria japonica TaxID=3369 RepID=UPI0027DA0888|nr:3-isopropylmalate dehydratase large subunit, chloroplastic isoform X3 [Cryptomeria japonica]